MLLSAEVLSNAAALLHDRGIPLSLASPFDSETDYLLNRLHVGRPDQGEPDEIQITCTAVDADETREVLTAIVDAFVAGLKGAPPAPGESAYDETASDESENERRQLARAAERQEQTVAVLVEKIAAASGTAEAAQAS